MMRILSFVLAWLCSLPALAAEPPAAPVDRDPQGAPVQGWIGLEPTPYGPMLIQQASPPPYRDYQMNRILTPEEKKRWRQTVMPMMANLAQMDPRETLNYFTVKYQAKPGVSFDEVVESMMLRANQLNLKFVGSNLMWKDFQTVLGDDNAPRVEVFSFCDIAIGRELLKIIPETVVFLPCRIAVMEDADKNIWVMMLDWEVTALLQLIGNQKGIPAELRKDFVEIRDKMENVMRAGANGEL